LLLILISGFDQHHCPPSENRLAQRIAPRKNFLSDCAGKIILDPAAILRYDWSITTKKDA
jgi:hypothetical protein